MTERRLLVSFSGGETSAFMTWWIIHNWQDRYDEIDVVFANTGEECEETLEFVRDCEERLGFVVNWIEAEIHHGERRAPTHRNVTFETAARRGQPFEDHIRKHGIPNYKYKDCTRNLKRKPIESYALRELGWSVGTYDLAIGIRADEMDRINPNSGKRRIVYPLAFEFPVTKPKINAWWSRQSFRLRLRAYQGNCRWCWKKSLRKLVTLARETPEVFDFPRRMEATYAHVGPEFVKDTSEYPLPEGYRRTFFRGNLSVEDIFAESDRRGGDFVPATDEAQVFDHDLDVGAGCEESCEVWSEEDEGVSDEE